MSNVNRSQLDEALELAPLAAVEVALNPFDDRALRGGIVERCEERRIAVIAHSPLGGPRRAYRRWAAWRRSPPSRSHAMRLRPDRARLAARALPADRADPGRAQSGGGTLRRRRRARARPGRARAARPSLPDVRRVRLARRRATGRSSWSWGVPGAGKSRVAEEDYLARGYIRLNRDERAGHSGTSPLRSTSSWPPASLGGSSTTRTSRAPEDPCPGDGGPSRDQRGCVWLDTPLAQAQVNLWSVCSIWPGRYLIRTSWRKLARREPGVHAHHEMRTLRELEPPSADEGFSQIEEVPFLRAERPGRAGVSSRRERSPATNPTGRPRRAAPDLDCAPAAAQSRPRSQASPGRWRARCAHIREAHRRAGKPAAAPRPASRLRADAPHRPGASLLVGTSGRTDARDGAGARFVEG